jgi:hypothetical protein
MNIMHVYIIDIHIPKEIIMKKLALTAAVAAIALTPSLAQAKQEPVNHAQDAGATPGHSYTVIDRDMDGKTVEYKTTTTSRHVQTDAEGNADFTGRYSLIDGRNLNIQGKTAYIGNEAGSKGFFAPNGAYVTNRGETFFVEDGIVLRLENPPSLVYVDTNDIAR